MHTSERVTLGAGVILFAMVAVATFWSSYAAISSEAVARGVVTHDLRWTIPVALDGLVLAASLSAWAAAWRGEGWHAFPLTVVAAAAAVSVWANVAHADSADLLSRVMAGVPPVGLLLTIELGAWHLRRAVGRAGSGFAARDEGDGTGTYELADLAPHVEEVNAIARDAAAEPETLAQAWDRVIIPEEALEQLQGPRNGDDPYADVWAALRRLRDHDGQAASSIRNAHTRTGISRHRLTQARDHDPRTWDTLVEAGV